MAFKEKFTGPLFTEPFAREARMERELEKAQPVTEESWAIAKGSSARRQAKSEQALN